MKEAIKSLRLLIAERLLSLAWDIAPKDSDLSKTVIDYFKKQVGDV